MSSISGSQPYTAKSSVFHSELSQSQTYLSVGKSVPIELPCLEEETLYQYLGEEITRSTSGAVIYAVEGSETPRILKVIFLNNFETGDEVRIAKKAAELFVAPAFHSACVVSIDERRKIVVLEMDDAGLSLGKWMEKFGKEEAALKEPVVVEEILTDQEIAYREMIAKIQAQFMANEKFVATVVEAPPRVGLDVAGERLYGSQEAFYFALFSRVRELAENNIAYLDMHVGNIMPQPDSETEMLLIDFGTAEMTSNVEEAKALVLRAPYGRVLFKEFCALPNLSELSRELMVWFAPAMQSFIDWEKLSVQK